MTVALDLLLLVVLSLAGAGGMTLYKLAARRFMAAKPAAALPYLAATAGCLAVSFTLMLILLGRVPVPLLIAANAGLNVVLATLAAWTVLGERVDARAIGAGGLIVAGVAVMVLAP